MGRDRLLAFARARPRSDIPAGARGTIAGSGGCARDRGAEPIELPSTLLRFQVVAPRLSTPPRAHPSRTLEKEIGRARPARRQAQLLPGWQRRVRMAPRPR